MSLAQAVKQSFKQAKCGIEGHLIDQECERKLFYGNMSKEHNTTCKRCHMPLTLVATDADTYVIHERYDSD